VSTEPHALTCAACRSIDRADGAEDGRLYKTLAPRVRDERKLVAAGRRMQDRAADEITAFAGSMPFVYLHTAWFAVWIVLNLGIVGAGLAFDKYPFGLLTMIVSLEAIFLSTFVMISQNRQAARADIRSAIDFENNLRGEFWAVHIGDKLGIDGDHVEHVVREAIRGYQEEGEV
jgi:uncharacterized membrane protein